MNFKLNDPSIVYIPNMLFDIVNNTSDKELLRYATTTKRARELIYVAASRYIKSFFRAIKKERKSVRMMATFIKKIVGKYYCELNQFLIENDILECSGSYSSGKSIAYWYTENAIKSGIRAIKLTDTRIVNKLNARQNDKIKEANKDTIAAYLLDFVYPSIDLPDEKDIVIHAKNLINKNYRTSKGQLLAFKKSNKLIDKKGIRYVEEDLTRYRQLTVNGLIVPDKKSYTSCSRVVDSFTLMPQWIRKLIKINQEEIIELDFTCLHPNLANSLYGNNKNQITHNKVAKATNKSLSDAKKEHLTFFNLKYKQFLKSGIHPYYQDNNPQLISAIKSIKITNYKEVTYQIAKKEVELMSLIIEKFKQANIQAIYVYDAMYVPKSKANSAIEIMNQAAVALNVNTGVKYD